MELDSDVGPNHLTSFQEQNFENCCNVPRPEYLEVDIAVFTVTSYGISDFVAATGGGGLKDPPLRYHGWSHFGLYIAIHHLLTRTNRGHMPKF